MRNGNKRVFRVAVWLAPMVLAAAPPGSWRAGVARAVITPAVPVPLSGFADRTQPFTGVDHDLFAKALAIEDAAGNRALLLTADVLAFSNDFSERVCRRLREATGIERESILLNASHTHYGPVTAPEMEWPPGGAWAKQVEAHVRRFEDAMVDAGGRAVDAMQPARLSWAVGVAPFIVNRRELTANGVILGLNPRGPADRSVPVLSVEGQGGELLAVVFGAAAHAVCFGSRYDRVNGDYPGYAQLEIERRNPGATALFVTGCAGDAAPFPRRTPDAAKTHGASLAAEVQRVLASGTLEPVSGPLQTELRRIDLPLRKFTRAEAASLGKEAWQKYVSARVLKILDNGRPLPERYNAPFALWQFGRDLRLAAFSGETVVDYVALAEKHLGPLNLWVAGYSNDVFGYLPSARVLREGGYETRGLYIGVGIFDPAVDEAVGSALEDMTRAVRR